MYTYINPSSGYHIREDGSLEYRKPQDGHGGHRTEHLAEMRQIAEQIADERIAAIVPQIQAAALQQAREDLLRAISFDVETVVSIAFANGETIWRDSKTQKVIADSLMREIRKRLDGVKI